MRGRGHRGSSRRRARRPRASERAARVAQQSGRSTRAGARLPAALPLRTPTRWRRIDVESTPTRVPTTGGRGSRRLERGRLASRPRSARVAMPLCAPLAPQQIAYVAPAGRTAPVLLVHAGVTDRRSWAPLVAASAGGTDRSPTTAAASARRRTSRSRIRRGRRDRRARRARASTHAIVIGASNGGRGAIELALAHPERVRALGADRRRDQRRPRRGPGRFDDAVQSSGRLRGGRGRRRPRRAQPRRGPRLARRLGRREGGCQGPVRDLFLEMNAIALHADDPARRRRPAPGTGWRDPRADARAAAVTSTSCAPRPASTSPPRSPAPATRSSTARATCRTSRATPHPRGHRRVPRHGRLTRIRSPANVPHGDLARPDRAATRPGGRRSALLYQFGVGLAFLATVRRRPGPGCTRCARSSHEDRLLAFIVPSPKLEDLRRDGRLRAALLPSRRRRGRLLRHAAWHRAIDDPRSGPRSAAQFVDERTVVNVPAARRRPALVELDLDTVLLTRTTGHGDLDPSTPSGRPPAHP